MNTSSPDTSRRAGRSPSLRSIALPTEHGGWGFTLEPALLGLLVAYSAAAWELAVAAIAVFLARRPFRMVVTDLVRRRWLLRSRAALAFAAGYGSIAALGLVGALATAPNRFLLAYLIAIPFAVVALAADARGRSRSLVAELSGAIAMGSTVAAIALADHWEFGQAAGLWAVLVARGVTTIVLVRGQIRRVHDKPVGSRSIYATQVVALAAIAILAGLDLVPWLAVVAIAGIGLLARWSLVQPPVAARRVGWTQMATGLVVVMLTATGVWLDW